MPAAQDTIFNEAQSAMQAGDRGRARDLLTRLLKTTQDNPDYWVWMSAVVDTSKERIFCLNQALKLDPNTSMPGAG
jgi:predicted Zn-dependent protease